MIRLFKTHAMFLLLLLIMWKQEEVRNPGNARRSLIDQVSLWLRDNPSHPAALWLTSFDWDRTIDQANVDEQVEILLEGVSNDPTNSKGDVSIIATIIDLLGLPWTGNRVGAETISALRKAILRPSEIITFQKIAKESFQCSSCSHVFRGNEAAIVQRGSNHELRVTCLRCATPSYGICGSCGEAAPINPAGITALAATKFVSCGCKAKVKKEVASDDDVVTFRVNAGAIPPPRPSAARNRLRDAAARLNAIPTAEPAPAGLGSTWVTTRLQSPSLAQEHSRLAELGILSGAELRGMTQTIATNFDEDDE